ncbi:MAG TPA: right-handed parallel beta-helix repeat-containing protein [Kofleriaceae bacterium]
MIRLLLLVVPLSALAGCKTENKAFCDNMNNAGLQGCPGDAMNGGGCGSDNDCKMMGFPACEKTINQGTCEPCTDSNIGVCTGTTPRCESNACVACADDVQDCKGGVCLATGDCADTGHIIHASSSKTMMTTNCGDTAANACSLNSALAIVTTTKNVIKLDDPGPFESDTGFVVNTNVTLDARGAILRRTGGGSNAVVTVNDNKNLTILGGTIESSQGDGLKCGNNSMLAVYDSTITMNNNTGINGNGCTISVTHATISNNSKAPGAALFPGVQVAGGAITISRSQILSNRGGGITVNNNATFTIVGNMFLSNGDSSGVVGGLQATTTVPGNRFDFNTLSGNTTTAAVAAGVQCTAPAMSMTAPLTVQNNVIWDNNGPSGTQVSGTCLHAYSDIGTTPVPGALTPPNANDFSQNPLFVGSSDLTVMSTSPIRGKANPNSDLGGIASMDILGVPRTLRPGSGPDLGAYVVPDK